jgi:acetoacetyl-CoA synthetase
MSIPESPLWTPPEERVEASNMERLRRRVAELDASVVDSVTLHEWSLREPEAFWALLAEHLLVGLPDSARAELASVPSFVSGEELAEVSWFPGFRFNVAEVILAGMGADPAPRPDDVMFVAIDERGRRRETTRGEARRQVAAVAAAMRAEGLGPGDRVAAWLPNTDHTVVVMLAAASIGAVFSSTSPDFGADGVLDRFAQVEPVLLVAADGYTYGGTEHDRLGMLGEIVTGLPSLRRCVVVPFLRDEPDLAGVETAGVEAGVEKAGVETAGAETAGAPGGQPGGQPGDAAKVVLWDDWVEPHRGAPEHFSPLDFDHPWYVLFSSGTTGVPKCIVHGAGRVLLQHLKEHQLHCDIRPGDRVCYFTTCGWMMWNWLVSAPASGATAVLYEGNPFHGGPQRLWDLVAEEALQLLGVSAKYIDSVRKAGFVPAESTDLSTLRTLVSTGSPLSAESFEWVYEAVAPGCDSEGLHLASISGGTDLCSCFVCGDPTRRVWAGEIQGPALGMATDVWTDDGFPAAPGERGELVCTRVFPSMPLGFRGDGPLGTPGPRYRASYFERFPGVWAHGDFATWTEHGGMIIHGRSDTTLNPGGVRIGTAEIYRQVEQLPEVIESLAFGREVAGDVEIVLLVRLAEHVELDEELVGAIRERIRTGCTPRHVPRQVLAVDDLPRTRSNKLAELAVADVVNGREVRNTTALANPESLQRIAALFADR